ncbi:NADH-ubiquinone oxidoreductase-F iron-sulfur binding region domain-containing protein [Clostridium estertheticum]|uniref:NADH-ubiquinone oxidoreductase-F iron-sulfur binding region domain-containing protein n=1 Tax=Clostridium estertheticum TaxID=238834 RepID=UPI001CF0F6B0|nr:NADH-ubiquinone oxidoreductase-F iron-sulfur binding region domain-containing protein [Clostridium estertheticum]MCB2357227.1 4Fe-4S binding protein [Clostridium estertheticum]WAG40408.1 4Fe-4S binding protein [Clostridium estertheticum]
MTFRERKLWKQASVEEIKDFVIQAYNQEVENPCPVDKMRAFTDNIRRTSCGECVICREGILQLNVLAEGITQGTGRDGDIEVITEVSDNLIIGSCCNYGKEVGKITKKIIEGEQEQFEKHIKRKRCDDLVCKKFFSYYVAPEKCNGCNKCVDQCPKKAIDGGKDLIHIIDSSLCDRCGECVTVCEAFAIQKAGPVVPKVPTKPVAVGSFETQLQNGGGLMTRKRRRRSE